eukprot:m.198733 g.198733  ORF g.198733 m.198733 type:complete len:57 (-) comp14923_c0_seq4:60-230(-)
MPFYSNSTVANHNTARTSTRLWSSLLCMTCLHTNPCTGARELTLLIDEAREPATCR